MKAVDRCNYYRSREHFNDHPYLDGPEWDGCQSCKILDDVSWKKVDTKFYLNVNGKVVL